MTLHCHRLYQISSLEANFVQKIWNSSVDRQKPPSTSIHNTPKLITKPYSNDDKKRFWTYLHNPWNTYKGTLSDVAEIEPTYTVGPLVLACWLLTLKLLLLALPITFFCLQSIRGFFSKLDPFNTKSISIPTPFYQWILLHLTYVREQIQMSRAETIHKVFAIATC